MSEAKQQLDPRIKRTRQAVQLAVTRLLSEARPFKTLTISEVAEAAGITRKTFYARFASLEHVVKDMALDLFKDTADSISDEMLIFPLSESTLTKVVFRAHLQHKQLLEPLVKHCPSSLFIEPCEQAIGTLLNRALAVNQFNALPSFERQYLIAIISSALHATLNMWIKREMKDSPDQLAELITQLLGPGVDGLLKNTRTLTSRSGDAASPENPSLPP